jgi:hypothetical protein
MSEQLEKWIERTETAQSALHGHMMAIAFAGIAFAWTLLEKHQGPLSVTFKIGYGATIGGFSVAVYMVTFNLVARYERHRHKLRGAEAREAKQPGALKQWSDKARALERRGLIYFYITFASVGIGLIGLTAVAVEKYRHMFIE